MAAGSDSMNILLEFGQSSRVVTANGTLDELHEFLEGELKKLDPDVKLVIDSKSQYQKKSECERPLFLQRFSSEWKQYVDVINVIEIKSGDRLKAVPFKWPANNVSCQYLHEVYGAMHANRPEGNATTIEVCMSWAMPFRNMIFVIENQHDPLQWAWFYLGGTSPYKLCSGSINQGAEWVQEGQLIMVYYYGVNFY